MVGISDGKCQITKGGKVIESIPVNTLDGITILGKSQLTTQMVEYCLTNGIAVSYFSKGGKYFGRLESGKKAESAKAFSDLGGYEGMAERFLLGY